MKTRCGNPRAEYYRHYGGRGIKVCERWMKFENFLADMGESYEAHVKEYGEKDTTIERNDVNGNYEMSNCRWATTKEQSVNHRVRKDSPILTYEGVTKTLFQWASETGLSYGVLRYRIKAGWDVKGALTTPCRK